MRMTDRWWTAVRALATAAATLMVAGCGSVSLREHVFLGREAWAGAFWERRLTEASAVAGGNAAVGPGPLAVADTEIHRAIAAAVRSICLPAPNEPTPRQAPADIRLARGHFSGFVHALRDDIAHQRFALASASQTADGPVGLPHLLSAYLSAYFSGKFVDRNGGLYSKPKLGTVVTNEAITGLAAVALEAVIDYEVMRRRCVYFPIYFVKTGATATFLTKDGNVPTLAKVVYHLNRGEATDDRPDYYAFPVDKPDVVVPLSAPAPPMVTRRLAVVRYFGGLTGDGAQSVSGMVMRDFGGLSVGVPVALGKFSVGDNETLSRLVDTVVEVLGRRLTEAAVSTALGRSEPPTALRWIFVGAAPDPLARP